MCHWPRTGWRHHNPNRQARAGDALDYGGSADSGCQRVTGGVEQEAGSGAIIRLSTV